MKAVICVAVACSTLFSGVAVAFMLAYKEADGDPRWAVRIGCMWAMTWMLLVLVITRIVIAFVEYRKSR